MVSQGSINRQVGNMFEEDVLSSISGECMVAAQVNETSGGHSTPDIVCVEKGAEGRDVTRLIESKFDSYVKPPQRKELSRIAENTPETTRIQIAHLDKDGDITLTDVGGNEYEEVNENLSRDFFSPKPERQDKLRPKYEARIENG